MSLPVVPKRDWRHAWWLKSTLLFQRTQVWILANTAGGSQPPVTPAPGNPEPSSGLLGHLRTHAPPNMHTE